MDTSCTNHLLHPFSLNSISLQQKTVKKLSATQKISVFIGTLTAFSLVTSGALAFIFLGPASFGHTVPLSLRISLSPLLGGLVGTVAFYAISYLIKRKLTHNIYNTPVPTPSPSNPQRPPLTPVTPPRIIQATSPAEDAERALKFKEWRTQYGQQFLAHCVGDKNVATKILNKGYVASALDVFFDDGEGNYELGTFNDRRTITLPTLKAAERKTLAELEKKIPSQFQYGSSYSSKADTSRVLHTPKESETVDLIAFGDVIPHFSQDALDAIQPFRDKLTQLAKDYRCSAPHIFIAYEKTKPVHERLYHWLGKVYDEVGQIQFEDDKLRTPQDNHYFYLSIHDIENRWYGTEISSTIRTVKNGVAWRYGRVAILRGGDFSHSLTPSQPMPDNRQEFILLPAWANHGEWYRIQLNDPHVFLLGPRDILEAHAAQLKEHGIAFQYTDNLTAEEKSVYTGS